MIQTQYPCLFCAYTYKTRFQTMFALEVDSEEKIGRYSKGTPTSSERMHKSSSEAMHRSSSEATEAPHKRWCWFCIAVFCASIGLIVLGAVLLSKVQRHNCLIESTFIESSLCEKYDYIGDGNRIDQGIGTCYDSYAKCEYQSNSDVFYCYRYHLDSGEQAALALQLQQRFPNGTSVNVFTLGAPSQTENHCNAKRSTFQEGPIISLVLGLIFWLSSAFVLLCLWPSKQVLR